MTMTEIKVFQNYRKNDSVEVQQNFNEAPMEYKACVNLTLICKTIIWYPKDGDTHILIS